MEKYGKTPDHQVIDALYHDFVKHQWQAIKANFQLIPGIHELLSYGEKCGFKFAVNTGYNREMLIDLISAMAKQGFHPDSIVCSSDVSSGRPAPWMSLKNAEQLGVTCVQACVKVDDTPVGIQEGLNAGMWTLAVAVSGNALGRSLDQWQALELTQRRALADAARQEMAHSGAHFVINTIATLPETLDQIQQKLLQGVRP